MKFVYTVVMLAFIYGAQSSVLPLGLPWGSPLSYTAVSGPGLIAAGPLPVAISLSHGPAWVSPHAAAIVTANQHIPTLLAAPALVAGGSYVAKTRGAVHVAPLPGHLNSAASINLEPAPGTL